MSLFARWQVAWGAGGGRAVDVPGALHQQLQHHDVELAWPGVGAAAGDRDREQSADPRRQRVRGERAAAQRADDGPAVEFPGAAGEYAVEFGGPVQLGGHV